MVNINLIDKWTNRKKISYNLDSIIFNKLRVFYEELNNIKLVHLNKINHYWCYDSRYRTLYLYNIILNKKKKINFTNVIINKVLNNLKIDNYKYVEFHIYSNKNNSKKNNNSIFNFSIKDINYYLLNFTIKDNEKLKKKNNINWSEMVPASSVRNYMLNDPLIDYLKEYNIHSLNDKPSKNANSITNIKRKDDDFSEYIKQAGIEFEEELYKIISKKHKTFKVADAIHARNVNKYQETINLMKKGVPIIYQGVLHNYQNKTYGLPDLLVRSDYINKLMGYNVISKAEEKIKSTKLKINYHYKVIDIKHSTINLKSDGIHILNSDSIPTYKGQLYIYTLALNKILGININKAFIWGKKYKINKIENKNFMNKLGVINYDTVDKDYINISNNAINWIKNLRCEGNKWKLLPLPCREELYPNMKNEKDGQWHILKNELNKRINEITSIWQCGIKKRKLAHDKLIFSWTNPLCNAELLGFNKKSHQYLTVNGILDINRQNKDIIRPCKILYDRINWDDQPNNIFEFYLDFETLNSNFGSIIKKGIISYDDRQYIFLIGLGYMKNKTWIFKNFLIKQKTKKDEDLMFKHFYSYINKILKINKKTIAKFYHWSQAEVISYNKYKYNKHVNDNNFIFYDLYNVFIKEPIFIKGALNYSLKTIAKTLYEHNLIDTTWNNKSPCSNGLNAMILAHNIYKENKDVDEFNLTMKEIIYYNEIDCKVMGEIHHLIKQKT